MKFEKVVKWFKIVGFIFLPVYTFGVTLYKSQIDFSLDKVQTLILAVFLSLFVIILLIITELSILTWDKSTSWLLEYLRKYPTIRKYGIGALFFALTFSSIMISLFYWQWDNLSRVIFFMVFVIFIPASLLSILKDERFREESRLSEIISKELIINNPQAAIEYAFTLFEDYLRKRLKVGSDVHGESLINLAYGKNGKLIYGEVDNENNGARNFISGTYATFRNPRKHRIVEDDEQTTRAIINLIELLFRIVDESKNNPDNSEKIIPQLEGHNEQTS